MRRRYRRNGLVNDVTNLGLAGGGLAVGSAVVSSIPGEVSTNVNAGFSTAAGFFPAMGGLVAVKYVVQQANSLQPRRRRRR